jgi:hypothetical protein
MTFIDVRHATQQIAMPFVSTALKPAMLDMKLNSSGMTGMLTLFVCNLKLVTYHCNINGKTQVI